MNILMLCLTVYLILAIPAFGIIWSAFDAAKHSDNKGIHPFETL